MPAFYTIALHVLALVGLVFLAWVAYEVAQIYKWRRAGRIRLEDELELFVNEMNKAIGAQATTEALAERLFSVYESDPGATGVYVAHLSEAGVPLGTVTAVVDRLADTHDPDDRGPGRCEHGVIDCDYCEECSAERKRALAEHEARTNPDAEV